MKELKLVLFGLAYLLRDLIDRAVVSVTTCARAAVAKGRQVSLDVIHVHMAPRLPRTAAAMLFVAAALCLASVTCSNWNRQSLVSVVLHGVLVKAVMGWRDLTRRQRAMALLVLLSLLAMAVPAYFAYFEAHAPQHDDSDPDQGAIGDNLSELEGQRRDEDEAMLQGTCNQSINQTLAIIAQHLRELECLRRDGASIEGTHIELIAQGLTALTNAEQHHQRACSRAVPDVGVLANLSRAHMSLEASSASLANETRRLIMLEAGDE
eukprot:m51a1_g4028 hypothetical protein (265) ;mRNA; r:640142-641213